MHHTQRRTLIVLFCTLLLDMIGIGIIIPVISVIFTDPTSHDFLLTGYPESSRLLLAGLVTAVFSVMQFFAAPILGELSDMYGRKRLLSLGVGILAISQFIFGFGIQIASLALIFISRAVAGLAAANFSIAQATIADVSAPEERAKNFGVMGAAFGLGFIVGPLIGGWVVQATGNASSPFWLAGILGVINLLSITSFLPETRKKSDLEHSFHPLKGIHNIQAAIKDVDARPVYLANFLTMLGFSAFASFSGLYLVSRFGFNEGSIGTYFAVIGVWIMITQLFILRITSKLYSEKKTVYVSLLALSAAMFAYPFMTETWMMYVLVPFIAIPQGLSNANLSALVSKSVSKDKQGVALGIAGSLMALAGGIAPLIGGIGSSVLSQTVPFFFASALILSAWYVLFIVFKHRQ